MITDHTLDQSIIEATRFIKAAKALRAARKCDVQCIRGSCENYALHVSPLNHTECMECGHCLYPVTGEIREHAATLRASMDLTRKLADLRQSR